jgi:non-canonical purine NTP pyrophosphatase (RdgB/HAM1 family)
MTARLVLATLNSSKLTELARILDGGNVGVENALLKAVAIAQFTGLPSVADDSGFCVDALNGMPGVLSARWSGRHGDDEANLRLLLGQLSDVPDERRGAHFTCAAALVLPSGRRHVSEGEVHGRVTRLPRGENGFGYDPIFVPDSSGLTTAEMTAEAKDAISHRGRALRALAPVIAALLGGEPANPSRYVTASYGRASYGRASTVAEGARVTDDRLAAGDLAPDFTLQDADGGQLSLSSLRGQRVIIYFYPAAMTPGCTKEACDFRDSRGDLSGAGFTVLGISPDEPAKLARFAGKEGLTFPLLSDPDREVLRAYGAYGEKMMYGKKSVGVIRSTFVVGADGRIENAYYGVKATGHVARLRKDLGV